MTLRRLLTKDFFGDDVDPDKDYIVAVVAKGSTRVKTFETVSGADLIAAAELFDRLMEEKAQDVSPY